MLISNMLTAILALILCFIIWGAYGIDDLMWAAARLNQVALMQSKLPRDSVAVTVVAPYSLERLQVLEVQCQLHHDGGLISYAGAVYLPVWGGVMFSLDKGLNGLSVEDAMADIQQVHQRLTNTGCVVDFAVFREDLPSTSVWFSFPANALRNKALALAQTEVVALVDADTVLGPVGFGNDLVVGSPLYHATMSALRNKTLLVLPVFDCPVDFRDSDHIRQRISAATGSKQALISEELPPLLLEGLGNTDYTAWKEAHALYYVSYWMPGQEATAAYEPYVVALKTGLPSFDERFRGCYYGRMSFFAHLHRMGYSYGVHPEAYVIHYPHATVANKKAQLEGPPMALEQALMKYIVDGSMEGDSAFTPFVLPI